MKLDWMGFFLLQTVFLPVALAEDYDSAKPSNVEATTPSSTPSNTQETQHLFNDAKLIVEDTRYVLTSPMRWEKDDWLKLAIGTAAVVGTAVILDHPIQSYMQNHRSNTANNIANTFEPFGQEYSFYVIGGFYLGGTVFGDQNARSLGVDGLSSSLIASVIITPSLKLLVGRSRPVQNQGAETFQPFRSSNNSFPSGHTTQAFVTAAVVANHFDSPWVAPTAYGIASLVGFARVYHDAHWTSDVLAGGLIGFTVGKTVVYYNQERNRSVSIAPLLGPDSRGLQITYRW